MKLHNIQISGSIKNNGEDLTQISSSVASTTLDLGNKIASLSAKTGSVISGSSQVIYSGLTGIPSGLVSGSSQLTSSYDARYVLSGSITQTTWDNIASKPSGIISGSSQLPSGIISGSAQLPSGIVSSSAQVISNLPTGTVSGSLQVDIVGTTNYSTFSSSISSSIGALSASISSTDNSQNLRLNSIEGATGSYSATSTVTSLSSSIAITTLGLSSSINSLSGSVATTTANVSSSLGLISSSLTTTDNSIKTRLNTIEGVTGSYATTGSNIFQGNQTITGSLVISQNLTVLGSSSITYVTSSQLRIDDNIITLNTSTPGQRFGGIEVYDSGSVTQATGSILWDSVNNRWIYQQSSEATYGGGILMSGPRSSGSLGSELTLTSNRVAKSAGGDHLNDTNITDDGTTVSINSNTEVTGTLKITGTIVSTGTSLFSGSGQVVASLPAGTVSGSSQIVASLPSGTVSGSAQIISSLPSGTVSGSIQVSLTGTTGFGTYLNQAVLTTSTPTFSTVTATTFTGALSGNASTATTAGALSSMNISQFTNNSGYITSYTETSTLANVTARGATTSTALTLNGKVTFSSTVANRPQFPGGILGLDTADGNFDIWGISRDYYPSHATAASAWGLRWNGDNNDFEFVGGGTNRVILDMDGGNITATGTLSASNFSGSHSGTSSGTNTGDQTNISGNAATAGGFTPSQTSGVANRIVVADANGYIVNNYFNASGGGSERNTTGMGYFAGHNSSDYYYRSYTAAAAAALLSGQSMNISGTATNITAYTINQNVGSSNSPTFSDLSLNGGLTINGSLSRGTYTSGSNYVTGADNIVLKGNASGVSGIYFESEKDGTSINYPSDFGFIQYFPYGIGGSSGESNRLVIGVSNDADDMIVLNPVDANGVKVRVGVGTTEYTVYHSGNIPTWNQNTTGTASNITSYTINQNLGTGNNPSFSGLNLDYSLHVNQANNAASASGGITLWSNGDTTTSYIGFKNSSSTGWGVHGGISSGDYATYFVMDTVTRGWIFRYANVGGTNFSGVNVASISNSGTLTVNGNIMPNTNNSSNLGSATYAWANVYTNDLHMSNMNKSGGNDVDGTNGNWTIQEGAENLYIINNNNGKKYKIDLTEIN